MIRDKSSKPSSYKTIMPTVSRFALLVLEAFAQVLVLVILHDVGFACMVVAKAMRPKTNADYAAAFGAQINLDALRFSHWLIR